MWKRNERIDKPAPEEDFHAWALDAARRAREGLLTPQELGQVAEELEGMGASERRELRNRLTVLLGHLLKWCYQPEFRGGSWEATITEQRLAVQEVLEDNPSLRPRLPALGERAYKRGVQLAIRETGLKKNAFPPDFGALNWTWDQVLDETYFPD